MVVRFGWLLSHQLQYLLKRDDAQVKNFKTYVKREIVHQSSLKHPFIVSLKEVRQSRPPLPNLTSRSR